MPLSPIVGRSLLPAGENMICPETVKQSVDAYARLPALISPDNSPRESSSPSSRQVPSQSKSAKPERDPLEIAREATRVALADTARKGVFPSEIKPLAPRNEGPKELKVAIPTLPPRIPSSTSSGGNGGCRLNKFVRRLHDMLQAEKDSGIVEWRRGLLVLHSTDAFSKAILPKYFNTRNFKTFRRQLNYYGFVHVRSFSTTGSTTTALWVNRDLAQRGSEEISSVLMLRRVEPSEDAKTAEGRRVRKEMAIFTVEEDIGVSPKSIQMEQIRSMANDTSLFHHDFTAFKGPQIPFEIQCSYAKPNLFPRLAQKPSTLTHEVVSQQVSRSSSLAQNSGAISHESQSDSHEEQHSDSHQDRHSDSHQEQHSDSYQEQQSNSHQDRTESADSDAEESAACLLLMLSKGNAPSPSSAASPLGHSLV